MSDPDREKQDMEAQDYLPGWICWCGWWNTDESGRCDGCGVAQILPHKSLDKED